jgi:hypothetical protein
MEGDATAFNPKKGAVGFSVHYGFFDLTPLPPSPIGEGGIDNNNSFYCFVPTGLGFFRLIEPL